MATFFRNTAFYSTTKRLAVALVALAAASTSYADKATALQPYTAQYRITNGALSATAERRLQQDGEHWRLSQNASVLFLNVAEESVIEEVDSKLRPLSY